MGLTSHLVVMAKHPALGRVKTRLAEGVGAVEAMRFYRHASREVLRRVAHDPRWRTLLALTPDAARHDAGIWPDGMPLIAQGEGDLGRRMGRLMRDLPAGPVVIIGSDIPDIGAAHIALAFRKLGDADAVFGPADDGGYWLVGLKRRPRVPEIFDNVRWSGEHALADTRANAERAGLRVAMLGVLADIDTAEDLKRWKRERRA